MKSKKTIFISALILLLLAGGFFGAKEIKKANTKVAVLPVSMLNMPYFEEGMTVDGMVYEAGNQLVYVAGTQLVTDVFVTKGQEVHKGDRLMAFDMTSQSITLEIQKLMVARAQNDVQVAQRELNELYCIKPIPEPSPIPPEPDVKPAPKPVRKKTKDAWNYLDDKSVGDYYLIEYKEEEKPDEDSGYDAGDEGQDESTHEGQGEAGNAGGEEANPGGNSDDEKKDAEKKPEPGSLENPYRYLVTEDGCIYGSFINHWKKEPGKYLIIEIREGNVKTGALLASWMINSSKLKEAEADAAWYVITHGEVVVEEPEEPEVSPIEEGYTAAELAMLINMKKSEITQLDLARRRAELELKVMEEEIQDGYVLARNDGVVVEVGDKNNPPQDGSPFLKVAAGDGVYVQGSVPELLLDKVTVGQTIVASSWETGESYVGKVTSVDNYPTESYGYWGSTNPNSSNYGFLAFFENAEDINQGGWLQLSLEGTETVSQSIFLPTAYIRQDSMGRYVMKDQEGKLTKQYVTCGRTYYGEVVEVTEGVGEEDYLAFPYGDGARAGVKTEISEEGGFYW